jgi:hypothetical protein
MSRSETALQDLKRAIAALEQRVTAAATSIAPASAVEHLSEWRKAVAARLQSGTRPIVGARPMRTTLNSSSAPPRRQAADTVAPASATLEKRGT